MRGQAAARPMLESAAELTRRVTSTYNTLHAQASAATSTSPCDLNRTGIRIDSLTSNYTVDFGWTAGSYRLSGRPFEGSLDQIYLLARVSMLGLQNLTPLGASESSGRREGSGPAVPQYMFSARHPASATAPRLLTPLIPPERDRCHVDNQHGSSSPVSRPVRHRPRRVISHVRDQAHVRARQGPRQAQGNPRRDHHRRSAGGLPGRGRGLRVKFLDQKRHARSPGALPPVPRRPPSSAISFCSDSIRQHREGWSVTGILTVKDVRRLLS